MTRIPRLGTFFTRVLWLAGLWWLLTGGDPWSWLFGGPVIMLLAAWRRDASGGPAERLRPWRLLLFIPFFVWCSLVGGCDVAWRALHWRLPIVPGMHAYRPRLPAGGRASLFFCSCANLFPGTLTALYADDMLQMHLLTDDAHTVAELARLERQVALLFGLPGNGCREGSPA